MTTSEPLPEKWRGAILRWGRRAHAAEAENRRLRAQLDTRAIHGGLREAMDAVHDEACEAEHPTYRQHPWVRLSAYDVTLMAEAIEAQLDGTADIGAVPSPQDPEALGWVKGDNEWHEPSTAPSPQDPPADTVSVVAQFRPYPTKPIGIDAARKLLDYLAANGRAVVHADVPHGSRAEVERLRAVLRKIVKIGNGPQSAGFAATLMLDAAKEVLGHE